MANCVAGVAAARLRSHFAKCRGNSAHRWVAALLAAALAVSTSWLAAAEPPNKASTSRIARDDAARSIPLEKLSPESRAKVAGVVNDASLFRRLPIQTVDCEPELFQYMANNPDVLVNIWHVMGVTNVSLERVDATHFRCTDGDGTTGRVEVEFRNRDTQVIYAEGFYDGPLMPNKVRGECVVVLKHVSNREKNGRYSETVRLDTFLRVDNVGIEIVARLFQGLVGRTIDHNFGETIAFLGSVSRTAEVNPRGMRRLASKLDQVSPERREQFVAVTDRVAEKLVDARLDDSDDNQPLAEVVQSSAVIPAIPSKR
jgi:hypothetical protein